MASDRGIRVEKPAIKSAYWTRVNELDLEIRKFAYMMTFLRHHKANIISNSQAPLIQRFLTADEKDVLQGIHLGQGNNTRKTLDVILALHPQHDEIGLSFWQKIERGKIRDIPVIGISDQPQSPAAIQRYELSSLYRAWTFYGLRPQDVFSMVTNLASKVSSEFTGKSGFRIAETLEQCHWYFKASDLQHKN